jgi:lipid II:glycine glycyltransferase (peptidoglycan interpeptide bridge formation enzyme)
MPTLNVDENINKIRQSIDEMTREILRLEGSLRVFLGFKENGLTEVDIPEAEAEAEVEAEAETTETK